MTAWRSIMAGFFAAASVTMSVCTAASNSPVVVRENDGAVTLENGIIAATIRKDDGNLLSLRFRGAELMSRGGGYWNIYGNTPGQAYTEKKPSPSVFRVSQDPTKNDGALGEITLRFPYRSQAETVPLDIEIRYTLRRGDSGLYGWTIADHAAEYPPFDVAASTVCLKLNPDVFDFLSVERTPPATYARARRLGPRRVAQSPRSASS